MYDYNYKVTNKLRKNNFLITVFIIISILLLTMGIIKAKDKKDLKAISAITTANTIKHDVYIHSNFPTFTGNISAYCHCKKCCGKDDGITASGKLVKANHTIAAGQHFPFGTKVMIEGFDGIIFEVEDRGEIITGNCIDVYMETHKEAKDFGRQQRKVWILYFPGK